jgi:hypothetical protein
MAALAGNVFDFNLTYVAHFTPDEMLVFLSLPSPSLSFE